YSPDTGLVYIPTWENYNAMVPQVIPASGVPPLIAFGGQHDPATLKPHNKQANDGWLQAWDPVARKMEWETQRGPPATSGVQPTCCNIGFLGHTSDKHLNAYNATTGVSLWVFALHNTVYVAPFTYVLDGVLHIAASVGRSAQRALFAPCSGPFLVFTGGC